MRKCRKVNCDVPENEEELQEKAGKKCKKKCCCFFRFILWTLFVLGGGILVGMHWDLIKEKLGKADDEVKCPFVKEKGQFPKSLKEMAPDLSALKAAKENADLKELLKSAKEYADSNELLKIAKDVAELKGAAELLKFLKK